MINAPSIAIIMGVSGAGKTTVGKALAERLDWLFADADDFHPEANVQKMAGGQPLNDQDRAPWLAKLREVMDEHMAQQKPLVLTCSALKRAYRKTLGSDRPEVLLVHLDGTFDLLLQRMQGRKDHFMPASQLKNQLATLEVPTEKEALIVSIDQPLDEMIDAIVPHLNASEA